MALLTSVRSGSYSRLTATHSHTLQPSVYKCLFPSISRPQLITILILDYMPNWSPSTQANLKLLQNLDFLNNSNDKHEDIFKIRLHLDIINILKRRRKYMKGKGNTTHVDKYSREFWILHLDCQFSTRVEDCWIKLCGQQK